MRRVARTTKKKASFVDGLVAFSITKGTPNGEKGNEVVRERGVAL